MENNEKNLFIISGTSKGLGNSLWELASEQVNNYFILINRQSLEINKQNSTNIIVDLSRQIENEKLAEIFEGVDKSFNNIFLINNAAVLKPIKPLGLLDKQDIINHFMVNLVNQAVLINEFIKKTNSLKCNKKVLNISSGVAVLPYHGLSLYCSCKAGLEMLTQCVDIEQKEKQEIKIMAFRPGVIDTGMQKFLRNADHVDLERVDKFKELHNINSLSQPEEIARKIYQILFDGQCWDKPVMDESEINI